MVEINEKILQKNGIYKTRELKEKEQTKLLKAKKEIERLTNITIEKLYVINESAWGKNAEKEPYSICILIDKRYKDLEKIRESVKEYEIQKKMTILFWTLCQFEKRKNTPTEEDYYIYHYGIKVYDSEKQPEINERIRTTAYAEYMENYRTLRSYIQGNPDYLMNELVRIYTLKIGYAAIGHKAKLQRDCEFVKQLSKDKKVNEIIDEYLKLSDKKEKTKLVEQFEEYLGKVKQVKFSMKLEEKPTMDVYGKLCKRKEKQGTLDIKTLTKEDLYIMYLIQEKNTFEIAKLYGVENKKISGKRDNWKIKLREKFFFDEDNIMQRMTQREENKEHTYVLLKDSGMMQFEKYLFPILEYMMDDEVYLLKEFWQFTEKEENQIESMMLNDKTTSYYKANMCIDLLLQNELVKEVDFKQYKITQKGKELIWYCYQKDIEKINIPIIYEKFGKVTYYSLYYSQKCPTELQDIIEDKIQSVLTETKIMESQGNLESEEKEKSQSIESEIKEEVDLKKQAFNLKQIEYEEATEKEIATKKNSKRKIAKVDFNKINEAKTDFGRKCEEIVYNYEIEKLKQEGREDKAKEVIWVSKEIGDGAGYDIESFENRSGTYEKIYIEVKGTDKNYTEPFDVSLNEILTSEKYKENYYIYRIAKVNTKNPVFYKVKGAISENFDLTAVQFKASKKRKEG